MNDFSKISVAYAEEYEVVRKGIVNLLNTSPNIEVVIEACNGKDLVRQLKNCTQEPDISIVDINMPEMNGFDTVIELKKLWPEMKVLVFTSFENELYLFRMIANGANGYLTKNVSYEKLLEAINILHHQGMYYSEKFTKPLIMAFRQHKLRLMNITPREAQLLRLCCSDLSYADIGKKIRVSTKSVEGFRDSLFRKLKVNSRISLVLFAVQFGYAPVDICAYGQTKRY